MKIFLNWLKRVLCIIGCFLVCFSSVFSSFFSVSSFAAESSSQTVAVPLATFVAATLAGGGLIMNQAAEKSKTLISSITHWLGTGEDGEGISIDTPDGEIEPWVKKKSKAEDGDVVQWQNVDWGSGGSSNNDNDDFYVFGSPGGSDGQWVFPTALVGAVLKAAQNYNQDGVNGAFTQTQNYDNRVFEVSSFQSLNELISSIPYNRARIMLNNIVNHFTGDESINIDFDKKYFYVIRFNMSDLFYRLQYPSAVIMIFANNEYNPSEYVGVISNNYTLQNKTWNGVNYSYYGTGSGAPVFRLLDDENISDRISFNCTYLNCERWNGSNTSSIKYGYRTLTGDDIYCANSPYTPSSDSGDYSWYTSIGFSYTSAFNYTNNYYDNSKTIYQNFPNWKDINNPTQSGVTNNISNYNLPSIPVGLPSADYTFYIDNSNTGGTASQPVIQGGYTDNSVSNTFINNYNSAEPVNPPDINPTPTPTPTPTGDGLTQEQLNESLDNYFPTAENAPSDDDMTSFSTGFLNWGVGKFILPSGIYDKIPFSIPYDLYLLVTAMFPENTGRRQVMRVSNSGFTPQNPETIEINADFSNIDVTTNDSWKTAPLIECDIDLPLGENKSIVYQDTIDLSEYNWAAKLVYIGVVCLWTAHILEMISSAFSNL